MPKNQSHSRRYIKPSVSVAVSRNFRISVYSLYLATPQAHYSKHCRRDISFVCSAVAPPSPPESHLDDSASKAASTSSTSYKDWMLELQDAENWASKLPTIKENCPPFELTGTKGNSDILIAKIIILRWILGSFPIMGFYLNQRLALLRY